MAGNPLMALACIEIALKNEPDNPDFLVTLAATERDRKRMDAAHSAIEKAAAKPGDRDAMYWFVRAAIAADRGERDAARDALTRGDAIQGKSAISGLAARLRREVQRVLK